MAVEKGGETRQVMYVALIGLQMIERIYIGPNEAGVWSPDPIGNGHDSNDFLLIDSTFFGWREPFEHLSQKGIHVW